MNPRAPAGPRSMGPESLLDMRGEHLLKCNRTDTNCVNSGRKIVEILKKNPKKDPSKYEEDDLGHMRKVVAYCKRHLAQEEAAKRNTDSKSYKSLKNWGHDPLKA